MWTSSGHTYGCAFKCTPCDDGVVAEVFEPRVIGNFGAIGALSIAANTGKTEVFKPGNYATSKTDKFDGDIASSISVPEGCRAELYEHSNFQGKKALFGPGDWDVRSMKKKGMPDNAVSSLKVLDGPTWMDSSDVIENGLLPESGDWDEDKFSIVMVDRIGAFGAPCDGDNKHVLVNFVCKPSTVSMGLLNGKLVPTAVARLPERVATNMVAAKDWTYDTWVRLEKDWRKKTSELGRGETKRAMFAQEGNLLRIDLHAEVRVLRLEQKKLKDEVIFFHFPSSFSFPIRWFVTFFVLCSLFYFKISYFFLLFSSLLFVSLPLFPLPTRFRSTSMPKNST
jgi:hypothetical protein